MFKTAAKKAEPSKMERRRPPIYRPRSRTDVLQYKQRCADLESQMAECLDQPASLKAYASMLPPSRTSTGLGSEASGSALELAQQHLRELNRVLREQLEESHSTNEMLTTDLQKLTNDFETLREEMLIKEDEWKDEEQAFNDYYSTEHNRLLNLWRDVVSVKRHFMDIQSNTERDLIKIKAEVSDLGREMLMACSRMDSNARTKQTAKDSVELPHIEAELETLKMDKIKYETELQMKDDRIQQLIRDIQNLEDRCVESDQNVSQVVKMQEEMEILESALRDIAQALIQDAETKDPEILQATHLHLSASTPVPQKSPRRSGRGLAAPTAFAESTISAVQAALHKYQSYIHELQVKLQSNKEQLLLVRKQFENSENSNAALEKRAKELVAQLDDSRAQCAQVIQERDHLHQSIDALKSDKAQVDRSRVDLNSMLDSLNQELLTVREELHKACLSHDLLEQQKLEADSLISSLEKVKQDYEHQLGQLLGESSNVQDSLVKKETIAANLEIDKKKLQDDLKKLEDEKAALQAQCSDHQSDIQSLRKELLQAEQHRLDLCQNDQNEKCKFLDIEKGKTEMELNQVTRERNDLSNQLTVMGRKRDALNEELMRSRQKLEQANETSARINRNLEELVKECEDKQCTMDAMDKEIQRMQELLAAVRSEKEALEAVLFDTQTNLETSEDKKTQLEKDVQELLLKQEQFKCQVTKLSKEMERSEKKCAEIKSSMAHQAGNKEVEFKQTVEKLRQQNEDNVKKLTEEREKIRVCLEKRLQQSMQQLSSEKNAEIQQQSDRIEALQNHIDNLCQQHEELMLRAENDKQQALLIAHHDQKALHDKLESTRRDLEEERETLERLKREATSRSDQDRVAINQLKDELNKFKARLEESKTRSEEEKTALQQKIEEIRIERDNAQNEAENLKVQLHLCEDKSESVSNLLHETTRKLKEVENSSECLRKELTDVRRMLADSTFEKEKYHNTNKELRDHVKRTESEKREQARQLEDALQKISSLEEVKGSLDHDRARLQNHIRDLEKEQLQTEHKVQSFQEELQRAQAAGSQQQQEEKELQSRLLNEVEERERSHQELHQLRKQMSELERNLEQTRQELNKTRSHSGQLEEQWHAREQDLLVHLEDSRVKEKRLEDQKHNLEVCLVDATQQIQELKVVEVVAKLGGAEGRVRALETQLTQLECAKREIEQKLFSVVSTLRRIGGIQLDGSVSMPYRLLSPSRRWSPARGHEDKDGSIDVDPEVVRKGVRNLMQQVAQIERERDDYKTQVVTAKKQLQEAQDTQSKGDHKMTKVLQSLRTLQEEKGNLEATLGQKNMELQAQNDVLLKKTEEAKQMREKVVSLELSLSGESDQKHHYEMQKALTNCENDRRVVSKRLETTQNSLAEMLRNNQILQDQVTRLNNELANNEVHKSGLESQLRLAQWPADTQMGSHQEEELRMQLHSVQKERNELRGKVDSMNTKN
ncbi:hypothetical protein HUJ04_010892 [Dendroctonus ponderosae]|nr:hypothetical protein HUJ04_010892 [Dendroctonus ponderosae]